MPSPSSIYLTDEERTEICALVCANLPLPEKYRDKLFGPGVGEPPPLVNGADFALVEKFPLAGEGNPGKWENLLIHGDNLGVLHALRDGELGKAVQQAGGLKLVYMDPPFDVGFDFCIPLEIGEKTFKSGEASCAVAFRDSWGPGGESFGHMLFTRLCLIRDILAPDGSIYLHCDWRTAPRIRHFMDHIFGAERFLGEIVWHYTGGGRSARYFSRKHDLILHYARSDKWTFNLDAVRVPYKKTSGYAKGGIVSAAGKHYTPHPLGTPVDDVWDLPIVNPMGHERLSYPTQKPETLLERIILASSNPGDLVADFFCGSGTTAAVAEKLGRKWLAVDSGAFATHTARKRLLTAGCGGFAFMRGADINAENTPNCGFFHCSPKIDVAVQRAAEGVRLELRGFAMPDFSAGDYGAEQGLLYERTSRGIKNLMENPLDWVDYWSVSLDDGQGPLCVWQSFRTRGDRQIDLVSGVIPIKNAAERVLVRVVDVLAGEHEIAPRLCL